MGSLVNSTKLRIGMGRLYPTTTIQEHNALGLQLIKKNFFVGIAFLIIFIFYLASLEPLKTESWSFCYHLLDSL